MPGLGVAATKLNICITVSVLLKGEQNNNLPSVGSKQHATQTAPQIFLFPLSLNAHTRSIAPGKAITPIQHTTDPCLKALKPPNQTPPEEPGGAGLRPIHTTEKAGMEAIKCVATGTHKPGGALLDANTTPVPTKGISSIEPASGAVEATTTRPKVLEPREKCMEWNKLQPPPPLPQKPPNEGMRRRRLKALPSPL